MTHPYIPLYVDDFEAATAHLTPEEDGVYNRLLRLCWRTPGCSVPNDDAWIARKIRLSPTDYERVARPVIDEFFRVQRGRLFQKRLREEYENITRKKSVRQKAGSAGGRQKAAKSKEKPSSIAKDLLGDTRAFPEPYPESEKKDSPLPPKGEKKARRKPETGLPEGFPDLKALQDAKAKVLDAGAAVKISAEAERFRNHAAQTDRRARDWMAAWRNWILNAIERAPSLGLVQTAKDEHDPWPMRMRAWSRQEGWNDVDWGPEPFEPGCRVPAHHLPAQAAE